MRCILPLFLLALAASLGPAQDLIPEAWSRQPILAVPPARPEPPVIDGHVNYQEWYYAAHVSGFLDTETGAAAEHPVQLYLCYDPEAVYVGLVIDRSPMHPTPKATFAPGPHDHIWWKDDNLELTIEPGPRDAIGHGYAFAGNSIGGWSDLRFPLTGSGSDATWTGHWDYAATRAGRESWHAELKIPVAQFDQAVAPAPGVEWRLAVMNQQLTPRKKMIDWTWMWSLGENEYRSRNKAMLRFVGPNAPIVRVSEIGLLRPAGVDKETGTERIGSRVVLYSLGTERVTVRCRAELYRSPDKRDPAMLSFHDLWDRVRVVRETGQPLRDPKDPTQAFRNEADLLRELNERYSPVAENELTLTVAPDKPGYFPLQQPLERGEYLLGWRVEDAATGEPYANQVVPFQILPGLDLALRPYFLTHQQLRVEATTRRIGREGDTVRLALAVDGQPLDRGEITVDPVADSVRGYLSTAAWPAGATGTVSAALVGSDGTVRERSEASLTRPETPAWFGNDLGRSAVVPPPFEPLRAVDDRTVGLYQRQYRFGELGLPESLIARGTELLARPMALRGIDGRSGAPTLVERDQRDAVWNTTAEAGDWRLATRSTVHYDGAMRFDLTLTPAAPAALDHLTLEIPLRPEQARLMTHAATYTSYQKLNTEGLGGGLGAYFERYPDGWMPFTYAFFLGTHDRGVQWFCESDRGWSNADEAKAIELVRGDDEVLLRVHFIDQPVTLTEPLRLSFGLTVTPTKDASAGAKLDAVALGQPHELRETGLEQLAQDLALYRDRGATYVSSYMCDPDHFGQPRMYDADDEAFMTQFAALCEEAGLRYRPYSGWGVHTNTPQFETFGVEMLKEPLRNAGWGVYWHNPASTFADWWLDGVRHLVVEDGFDGIYMDGTCLPELSANELDGFAWTDEAGSLHGIYPIWAIREFIERLYVMLHHELRPDGIVDLHDGREPLYFINAFTDTTVSGEFHLQRGKTILEVFDPAEFAAYYATEAHGNARRFIWWNWMKLPILRNEMRAMAMLHDTPLVVGGGILKYYGNQVGYAVESRPWSRLQAIRNSFDGAELRPYWDQPPVTASTEGALSTGWLDRGNQRLLVLVANLTAEPWSGTVTLADGLDLPAGLEWRDAMWDQPLGYTTAEPLPLAIEPQRYRLLVLNDDFPLPEPIRADDSRASLLTK